MILQHLLFPSTETCTEEAMYFRRTGRAEFYWCADSVKLYENDAMYFDTYFNSFSAEKWFKYTSIGSVFLTVRLKGKVRLTLMRKEKIGPNIEIEWVAEMDCESKTPTEFTVEFTASSNNGMYCFQIVCEKSGSEFYGGYYSTDISADKLHSTKIAIDICTFKREKFVERNLGVLNSRFLENPDSELYGNLEVFISDNAQTLDAERLETDYIHIFKNKNAGGAGGFTRGLMEISRVKEEKSITHALIMDDDILIEPESVFRTFNILRCLKEQYADAFIGGAMLRLDHRNMQVESGAAWNGGKIISFKGGLNLSDCDACLFNEFEENAQFNAWWYCAIPIDIVRDDNLPMPIFIRGDDVEYGLRNMKRLILMNGICVWHEPFEKKYSSFLFYYILRNRLIDNSLHDMTIPKKEFIELLTEQVMEQVRLYRYKNANLLMRGVEDFLRGVNWFAEQDGEALHKEIMSQGYKLQYLEDMDEPVQFLYPLYEDSLLAQNPTTRKYKFLHKHTTNGIFHLPTNWARPFNIVPVEGAKDINVYRTEKVLNYDYNSRKGFITYKSPDEAAKTLARLKSLCGRLEREYYSAVQDYTENGKMLMSREFWEKYLEIEQRV